MKQITQIETKEYNELFKLANANSEEIERRAQQMFQEKGISKLVIRMQVEEDSSTEISLDVNSYVYEERGHYALSEQDKRHLIYFAENKLRRMMDSKYGSQISDISRYKRLIMEAENNQTLFCAITFTGWFAAIVVAIIGFLK